MNIFQPKLRSEKFDDDNDDDDDNNNNSSSSSSSSNNNNKNNNNGSLRKNLEAVPGNHLIDSQQKIAVLGTSHMESTAV